MTSHQNLEFDIVIVGGGMVGATMASLLRGMSLRIALIDRAKFDEDQFSLQLETSKFDPRVSALTSATKRIFEELGQSFWVTRQPNGYSSKKEDWMTGEMFERRMRFSESIYNSRGRITDPDVIMDRIGANNETRKLLTSLGMSRRNQFIALMCSPELMGLENA